MTYKSITVADALLSLRPNSQFCIKDNLYENIEWAEPPVKEGGQTLPSFEEVEAEVKRLKDKWEYNEYQRLRAKEYPDFKEYLDGIVKGDQQQIQSYIDKCLEVKAKYPKPEDL